MSIYAHNFFDRDQRVTTTPNCHKLSAIAVVPRFITRQMDEGSSVSGSSSSSSRSSGFVHNVVADRSFVAARRPVLSFLGCARLGFVSFRRDSSRPGRRLLSLSLSLLPPLLLEYCCCWKTAQRCHVLLRSFRSDAERRSPRLVRRP